MDEPDLSKAKPDRFAEVGRLVIDQSIREDGSLSPVIDEIAEHIQVEHGEVFDLAYRLNRLVVAEWLSADNSGEVLSRHRIANRMMLRALNSFAGCTILARRGMEVEAQTLARTIYECAFWLGYFHTHPDEAVPMFVLDNDRSIAQHTLALATCEPGRIPDEEIKDKQDFLDQTKKKKVLGPMALAKAAKMDASYVHYKWLCGMSAHSSVSSLDRYLTEDKDGHEFDFSGDGIPRTMGLACHGLIEAFIHYNPTSKAWVDPEAVLNVGREVYAMIDKVQRRSTT
jgi:hypothetical protein